MVEVHVKTAKGGTPAFWEELADVQAALVHAELERVGVPAARLNVVGLAGNKGQNVNTVVVHLDKDVFPDASTEGSTKPEPKRGASPNRRGASPPRR